MPQKFNEKGIIINDLGELIGTVEKGDILSSEVDQKIAKARREKEQEKEYRRKQVDELGRFILLRMNYLPDNISMSSLGRLTMLSTFIGYDNKLMLNEHTVMLKKDLPKVLNLNDDTCRKFLAEVSPRYVKENEDGLIFVSDIFYKGENKRLQKDRKTKLFIETARNLYYKLKPRSHKYFGIVINLIPYINVEYNILCKNPDEKDIDLIEPITVGELCDYIGFDKSNSQRLIDSICGLLFEVSGNEQSLCSVVHYTTANMSGYRIFVNPRVLFNGSNYTAVEVLCTFFPQINRCYNQKKKA